MMHSQTTGTGEADAAGGAWRLPECDSTAALPLKDSSMTSTARNRTRVVLHVDLDAFYCKSS